jgi:outer membrane autotransporter protein
VTGVQTCALPIYTDVNITTGPSHSIYYNLGVTPTFSGPTPGFTDGTIAATFDPTVFKGSINELADLNNNITSVANKNLSNFKDRQFSTSVFASQLEHKADAVNLKQEIDQLGVVFAYDYKLADTNLNFMAGYANSDLEANSRFAKSYANKSKGPFIGVAGIYDAGLVNVNFGLTTGLLKHSHDRFVNDNEVTNGEDHAKANYDSMFIAPEIGVSKKIKSNGITFSPKANVRYNYQSVDGYTETGSNSNATVKSLDVGLVETNLELAGTKSLNKSSYTIKTGYLNRQSVGDHKATVTMIGQTNSIGFGDKSNNIYYAGVGADLNLANFKLSFDLNQYLGDAEGVQGMVKLSSSF